MTRPLRALAAAAGLALLSAAAAPPAPAAGDPAKGKKVFNKCRACHKLAPGRKAVGPNLNGFLGRRAGTLEGFKFSRDMRAAGAAGLVWTEEVFLTYMADPKAFVGSFIDRKRARTRMAFNGLKKAKDREDLLAFLREATK